MADRYGNHGRTALDGLRLAIGTLTVIPVRVTRADRAAARVSMLWAPAVGALVGLLQYAVLFVARWAAADELLAAALAIGAGAVLTRGLHLDGLADVADGLGSGRPAGQALDIMKRSDIGPFGVVTLLLTLLIQVAALTAATGRGAGGAAIVVAATAGRLALPWACRRGVPAARPEGLGAMVAGTVPPSAALAVSLAAIVAVAAPVAALTALTTLTATPSARSCGTAAVSPPPGVLIGVPLAVAGSVVLASVLAGAFRRHAVRRLGGVTGDVLGALVEISSTVVLIAVAVIAHAAAGPMCAAVGAPPAPG